jgi:hypothetical protein
MVRIRQGWLVVVLGVALVLVSACKKDDKKADPAAGDKPGDKSGDQTAEKPASPSGAATEDLALLPVDSEVVMGINVGQMLTSSLWKQLVEPKVMTPERVAKLNEFKAKCGFDFTAIKSVALGMKASGDKPEGVIVMHGLDKAKAWDCADKMKDEMAKDGSEFTRDGDVALVKDKKGETMALTFVNNSTAVAVLGDKANAAGVKAVTAGNSGLKTSQQFTDMFGKVKSSDTLWMLVNGKLLEKGASMGLKANAVYGSINVTDGLTLDMRLRTPTPEDATAAATMFKAQSQGAAQMFDKIDVTNDGNEVRFAVVLSGPKLEAMIKQFQGLLGAFGGMGRP